MRDLIDEIRVIPRGKGEPVALEIVGDLAALMATEHGANSVTGSMVAGACNSQCSHRIPAPFRLSA